MLGPTRQAPQAMDARTESALRAPPSRNESDMLQLVWSEGRISRADIARRLDLSRSTVSSIVAEFLKTRLVKEVGAGESRGGRRPIVLEFQYDSLGLIGVDMGASHIAVALVNLGGNVLAWEERAHAVRTDPDGTITVIGELIDACLSKWGHGVDRLVGIGVGVPSPVDPRNPDHLNDVVMPAWKGRSVPAALAKRFGVPVLVDNDANVGALAEHWWGAGRSVDDLAFLKVATGIGSGHIIGGSIYRGASGTAGEIGHMAIDPQGAPCVCGLRGCLVTLVGTPALLARAKELRPKYPKSRLAKGAITLTAVEDAALAGDPLALAVVHEAGENLGIAVAGMLNLMNPALVAIGGSLARLGDLLLDPLREAVRLRTLVSSVSAAAVVASELGPRDIGVGAATLVLKAALEDFRHFPVARSGR